jgi:PAS domain S-box-containing protein
VTPGCHLFAYTDGFDRRKPVALLTVEARMNKATRFLLRYGTATVSVVLAVLVRRLLDPALGDEFPFTTLFFAVTLSAWYGGFGPALLAVSLGAFSSAYFLIPPRGSFAIQGLDQQIGMALYLSVSVGIALFGGSMRLAQRRAEVNAQAEHAQREQLRVTLESIGDAVIVTDAGGRVTLQNPAAQNLTGWRKEDASGQPLEKVFNIANETTGRAVESPVTRVLREGTVIGLANHTVLIANDGTQRPIEDSGAPIRDEIGTITGVVLVFRDVSERRRIEEAVRQSEARKAAILESALDAVITIDHQGKIIEFNPAAERTFGYSAAEVMGQQMADLFIPQSLRDRHHRGMAHYLATGEGPVLGKRIELPALRADGSEFPIELAIARISSDGPPMFTAYVRDITERIRAEEARSRLAAIVDSSEDAIIGKTLDGIITDWNPGAERLYGYSAKEIKGKHISMLVPYDRFGELPGIMERLRRGEPTHDFESVRVRKDGKQIEVSVRISPIKDGQGLIIGASTIARDISQTKQLEEQLRQAQKMKAVGQLAGGVAHDFNNLLTVISGYSELLLKGHHSGDTDRSLIEEIYKAGERAALTRQLMAFSRKQVNQPKVLDLNAIVGETEKMLGRLIGEDIKLTTTLAADLGAVKVDPGQVEQVIMNLAVNARDAMPKGGKLTLETVSVDLDENYAQSHLKVKPGRYAMLAVSDTGCGMDEATKARIFEPFFTTKGPGKGTGLGLATVYGIVKQSGGHIGVYSEPGRGTTFKVYLPVVQERISSGKSHPGLKAALQGTETVLLVEDEPAVRSLSRLALQMYGYKVLEACQGDEAIRVSEQHQRAIHLLLTDVVMPGMSGRQVAETLRSMQPAMRVLYLSGYTDDAVVRHGVLEAETAFLQKPFTPLALASKVREVLDQ